MRERQALPVMRRNRVGTMEYVASPESRPTPMERGRQPGEHCLPIGGRQEKLRSFSGTILPTMSILQSSRKVN